MLLKIMGDRQNYLILSENIIWISQGVGQFKNIIIIFTTGKSIIEIEYNTSEKAVEVIEKISALISIEPPVIIY